MSLKENKELVRRWVEARNNHDLPAALPLWVDEMHERLTRAFNRFTEAFPDLHVTIEEMIAEGDKVVLLWTLTGTHGGLYRGIPATGTAVRWRVIDIYTVANGRLTTTHVREADSLQLLQQLGATAHWQGMAIE